MIPEPLHPAVVHFPIVLACLLPLLAAAALWAIRGSRVPRRAWLGVVLVHALLVGSAWAAVATGEREEERVEAVVVERLIEDHEEAAERFLIFAALMLPISAAGLLGASWGSAARGLGVVAAVAMLGAGSLVGHSGGELVYRHGAAAAYAKSGAAVSSPRWALAERDRDDEDDDD